MNSARLVEYVKRLGKILNEEPMTYAQAVSILELPKEFTKDDVDAQYKKLSKKHHPDLGGDTEKMQQINVAKDFFDTKGVAGIRPKFDWEASRKKNEKIRAEKLKDFLDFFNKMVPKYTKHFAEFFPVGEPKEISKSGEHISYVKYVWTSDDKEARFILDINIRPDDSATIKIGGEDAKDYSIDVSTYVWINGKEHKMFSKSYKWNAGHKTIEDPENIFPKNKIEKAVSGGGRKTYSRRDFIGALKVKLDAHTTVNKKTDWAYIPVGGDLTLLIFRQTMMREAAWYTNGIYKDRMKRIHFPKHKLFAETPEGFKELQDYVELVKKDYSKT